LADDPLGQAAYAAALLGLAEAVATLQVTADESPREARGWRLPASANHARVALVRPYRSPEGGMENQGVPEVWIGQEVVLHTISDREFVATLVEIKDFGFAYQFRAAEDIIFAPWSVLRWMRLAGEGDEFYRT
jgi:hypothetical protein